jgi:hypothetical protein
MFYFPKDIWTKIYLYDPTYKKYFEENIIPLLKKQWYVTWTCKYTGKFGFDLSLEFDYWKGDNIIEIDTMFPYHICKKICDKFNKANKSKNYVPYKSN